VSHPTDDDLVDLALGELVDAERSAHVAACDECSATVEQLRRTVRLASGPVAYAGWQAPDDAVWARVTAQIDADDPPVAEVPEIAAASPPDETAYDRRVHRVHGDDRDGARRPSRRRTAAWVGALVAASLVVGLLAGRAIWSPNESGSVSQVALKTLDTRQREGEASVVRAGDGLDLNVVTDRPLDAGDGYLEVWLINADGKRMVSVGVLRPGEAGSFPISQALIDQGYVVVDISKEQFDDKPAHSGDSLLRGKLPA